MRAMLLAVVMLALLVGPVAAARGAPGDEVGAGLAALRAATARFHDPEAAVSAGYLATEECAFAPGLGTMGYHYVNLGLFDASAELLEPEALLYAPSPSGPRLVAVEWVVVDVGQPTPEMLGVPFDGPMPGHFPGMPVHYDLHAWIWQANPAGMFAQFNPTLSC